MKKIINSQDFSYLKKIIDASPKNWFQNIYLYITEKCQLHCKHCYLGERLKKATIMPTEKVFENLTIWKELGGKKLCFLGGEPTLHPNFEDVVKYANKLKYEKITLDSNGLQVALNKLINLNCSDFTYIQISLDGGSSATNDKIRGRGTFEIVLNTIKELCRKGFDIRIICTVNRHNLKNCLNILSIADELGVTLVKYHIFSGIGKGKEINQWVLDPLEWRKFINTLLKQKGRYKTKIQYQAAYTGEDKKSLYFNQGYRGCIGRSLGRVSIFPDNRVYICSYLFDTDLNFADMLNGQLRIRKDFNELNLFFVAPKKCNHCKFNEFCFGGCPAEKIVTGSYPCNKYAKIFPICRLWKSTI